MGWKTSTIIITDAGSVQQEELLHQLGFTNLAPMADEPFEAVMNPPDNQVYVGKFRDHLLICAPDLPLELIEGDEEKVMQLQQHFPHSEICALVLHSVVNLWAYVVVRDGKRIRKRAGSADNGTFIDEGEPLEEEIELLNTGMLNDQGQREYPSEYDDEPMSEDQVGEEFVFRVSKRYFGAEMWNDEVMNTMLAGYSYKTKGPALPEKDATTGGGKGNISIWKAMGIVAVGVVVWRLIRGC